ADLDDELRDALAQWDLRACVLVASAELDLRESQRRPAIALDASAGPQRYIEDCHVCCRPITVVLDMDDEGEAWVRVQSEHDA
ncbi:MAG TPA: CPXCG motif-containing cysteine-rich protein, partial [Thermomonas sp.]|nr:CPXCG motif-containing cysteine-rich protein [Thermomonas sp.]